MFKCLIDVFILKYESNYNSSVLQTLICVSATIATVMIQIGAKLSMKTNMYSGCSNSSSLIVIR